MFAFIRDSSKDKDAWTNSTITSLHLVVVLVRCIRYIFFLFRNVATSNLSERLLAVFNLAKYTMREMEEESEEKKRPVRKSFWSNPKLVSEKYMLILYASIMAFVLIFPIINTAVTLSKEDPGLSFFVLT